MMEQHLENVEKMPYSTLDYFKRVIWTFARLTIWKLLWHKLPSLRMLLLKLFGAKVQTSSMAYGSAHIFRPWDLTLGKYVALGPRVRVYNLAKVIIKDNAVISQDVYLCGGTHDHTKPTLPLKRCDIIIGSNVWVCAGAFIGPGVVIGDGSVIGARAVVMKNVDPYTIVGGNPAKFIKKRVISDA